MDVTVAEKMRRLEGSVIVVDQPVVRDVVDGYMSDIRCEILHSLSVRHGGKGHANVRVPDLP